eukprot:TRINITY_DN2141_c1_g2_i1.p1 TRINITY_DN2141_c1_g2~~TRINITY_DN2141_c1_g2_i1.p1  ORF type:complete len:1153 (+),score=556.51 TRINITY_DN2141_c1_g2_i1:53-3460(+)
MPLSREGSVPRGLHRDRGWSDRSSSGSRADLNRLSRTLDETKCLLGSLAALDGRQGHDGHWRHAAALSPRPSPRRAAEDRRSEGERWAERRLGEAERRLEGRAEAEERSAVLRRTNDLMLSVDKLLLAAARLSGAASDVVPTRSFAPSRPLPAAAAESAAAVADALLDERRRIEGVLQTIDEASEGYAEAAAAAERERRQLHVELDRADADHELARRRNHALLADLEAEERRAADDGGTIAALRQQLAEASAAAPQPRADAALARCADQLLAALALHHPPIRAAVPAGDDGGAAADVGRLHAAAAWLAAAPPRRSDDPAAAARHADELADAAKHQAALQAERRQLRDDVERLRRGRAADAKSIEELESELSAAQAALVQERSQAARWQKSAEAPDEALLREMIELRTAQEQSDADRRKALRMLSDEEERAAMAEARLREAEKRIQLAATSTSGKEDLEEQLRRCEGERDEAGSRAAAAEAAAEAAREVAGEAEGLAADTAGRLRQADADHLATRASLQRRCRQLGAVLAASADRGALYTAFHALARAAALGRAAGDAAVQRAGFAAELLQQRVRADDDRSRLEEEVEAERSRLAGERSRVASELEAEKSRMEERAEEERASMQERADEERARHAGELGQQQARADSERVRSGAVLGLSVGALRAGKARLEEEKRGLERRADELEQELAGSRQRVAELESELRRAEERSEAGQAQESALSDWQRRAEEWEAERAEAAQRLAEVDAERSALAAELDGCRRQDADAGGDAAELRRQLDDAKEELRRQRVDWEQDRVAMEEAFSTEKLEWEGERAGWAEHRDELERELQEAVQRRDGSLTDTERDEFERKVAQLHYENERLLDDADRDAEISEARAAAAAAEAAVETLRAELQAVTAERDALQDELRRLQRTPAHTPSPVAASTPRRRSSCAAESPTTATRWRKAATAVAATTKLAPRFPYLGLDVGETRDESGGIAGAGLRVVESRGPAAAAGLLPGDLITYVKDHNVRALDDLKAALLDHPVSEPVYIRLVRNGTLYDVKVQPAPSGRRPGEGAKYTNKVVLQRRGGGVAVQRTHSMRGPSPQRPSATTPRRVAQPSPAPARRRASSSEAPPARRVPHSPVRRAPSAARVAAARTPR